MIKNLITKLYFINNCVKIIKNANDKHIIFFNVKGSLNIR